MNVIELGPGQEVGLPRVPIRVRVTSTSRTQARLDAIGAVGAHRISAGEIVVLPKGGQVQLSVAPAGGGAFAENDQVGLSLRAEGGKEQVEVAQSSVVSMNSARLAVLEIGVNLLVRATGPQRAPEWLASGINALRRCGVDERDRAEPGEWAMVVDGSASMLSLAGDGSLEELLRLVCGVLYGWTNRLPGLVLRTTTGPEVDVTAATRGPELELATLLAPAPAAWSRVAPAVRAGARKMDVVVLLTDGVPVDAAALSADLRTTKGRLIVVTTGRSRFSVGTRAASGDLPSWQEELAGLEPVAAQANGRVVALPTEPDPARGSVPRLVLDDEVTARFAAAMVAAPVTGWSAVDRSVGATDDGRGTW